MSKRSTVAWFCVVLAVLAVPCWLGCGSEGSGASGESADANESSAEAGVAGDGKTADPEAAKGPEGSLVAAIRRVGPQPEAVPAPAGASDPASPANADPTEAAWDVIVKMAAAYKNASSYEDHGKVYFKAKQGEEQIEQTADISVAFVRPNKIRVEAYQAKIVCDGKTLWAAIEDLPGQVVKRDAPESLTLMSILADQVLAMGLSQGMAGMSPPLILLLSEQPTDMLLGGETKPQLLKPGQFGDHLCDRVQVDRQDVTFIFWVDRQTHVLRRIEFPPEALAKTLPDTLTEATVSADFLGARFGAEIDEKAFQFEAPEGSKLVRFFEPPHPAQFLGEKAPDFSFVDLKGNAITPQSLAGKVAVVDFWATWCMPCRESLGNLEKVRAKFKDDDRVVFWAVSVDPPGTADQALVDMFDKLRVHVPIARDPQQHAGTKFYVTGVPTTFILGADGRVQDFEAAAAPNQDVVLEEKLQNVLAGESIFEEPLAEYRKQLKEYEASFEQALTQPEGAATFEQEIPQAEIAPQTDPKAFRLTPLWTCSEVAMPGNIYIVPAEDGAPRILVMDSYRSVAELDAQGKVARRHDLGLEQQEAVSTLRTAVGGDGKRLFVGFANVAQRLHLFDAAFRPLVRFPEDALENNHAGIADVELADLDGDGALEMYVGYWGTVGVQRVSLEGKRVWSNRKLQEVLQIAVGARDAEGRRPLICTNNRGTLVALSAKGENLGEVPVRGRTLYGIEGADLDGDDIPEWCGLSTPGIGLTEAVGVNYQGQELWAHEMPRGVQQQPVEQILVGRLLEGPSKQWILPGADGSIHVLDAKGVLVDRFNYGAVIAGLLVTELDGQRVMLVSADKQIKAWKVEPPGQ